jgi:hypothetical protein
METKSASWQEHFGLTVRPASAIDREIPPTALGVAVIYASAPPREQIFLVIESRAGALLTQCNKRLQTAKLPPLDTLTVAFKAETLSEATPEAIHAACREQVVFAGELRRELRPAMR